MLPRYFICREVDLMARTAIPARYPLGPWPGEMRADLTAAFFDHPDTASLFRAVERGEAPRPTSLRGKGSAREPVWCLAACEDYLARRHDVESTAGSRSERLEALV